VAAVRELRPSVLVVNKCFGSHTVMDWLRIMHADAWTAAVVVWGSPMSESEAWRLLQAGAVGVIRQTAPLDELALCIRTVATGGGRMESAILRDKERCVRTGRFAARCR